MRFNQVILLKLLLPNEFGISVMPDPEWDQERRHNEKSEESTQFHNIISVQSICIFARVKLKAKKGKLIREIPYFTIGSL